MFLVQAACLLLKYSDQCVPMRFVVHMVLSSHRYQAINVFPLTWQAYKPTPWPLRNPGGTTALPVTGRVVLKRQPRIRETMALFV